MQIELPQTAIIRFCQRHHIQKLSVFGSVLRDDFGANSDVDFLVEFDPDHIPGLIRLAGMELELSTYDPPTHHSTIPLPSPSLPCTPP